MEKVIENIPTNEFIVDIANESGSIDICDDYVLPEHLDDAKKIVKCDCMLRPGGRYVSGGDIEYEGEIVYSVLYITDANTIKSAVFRKKYTRSFNIPDYKNLEYSIKPVSSSCECKLVNPRKISIRCTIDLCFCCMRKNSFEPIYKSDTPEEDKASCETLKHYATGIESFRCEKHDNRVSRDFTLPDGKKTIKEIINAGLKITDKSCDCQKGKVYYKGTAVLSCLFIAKNDENTEYDSVCFEIPLDGSIENTRVTCESTANICIYIKELSVSATKDANGDLRVLEADMTFDVCSEITKNYDCQYVSDAYSCDYKSDIVFNQRAMKEIVSNETQAFDFSGEYECPHTASLMYVVCDIISEKNKYDENKKTIIIDYEIKTNGITKGDDGRINAFEYIIPLRAEIKADKCDYNKTEISIKDFSAELRNEKIVINGCTKINLIVFEIEDIEYVSEIMVDHLTPRSDTVSLPITFYYPDDDERLWDIAKKYGSSIDMIKSVNEIKDDKKIGKSVLLIPHKTRKPLFSKVISK